MNRLLAVSLFTAGTYGLTLLTRLPVATADTSNGFATPPSPAALTRATAALADGDDLQSRAILTLQSEQLRYTTPMYTLSPATAALADSDDLRSRFILSLQP